MLSQPHLAAYILVHPVIDVATALRAILVQLHLGISALLHVVIHRHLNLALSSRVRRTPPPPDATHTVKKVRVALASGSRGRITTRDFKDGGKSILRGAFGHFESRLCTEWPYPDEDQEIDWAKRAWSRASRDKGVNAELMPQALRLVLLYIIEPFANSNARL
jgi:hypothetical protein